MRRTGLSLHPTTFATALWLLAPAAFGQTAASSPPPLADTLTGEAKQDYEAGKRLYESGDYGGALGKFERASRSSADPRLLWDEAVCERAMQRFARAVALVHRYLDSHSPLISPAAERDALDFLSAAGARTARLDVHSSEPGATVLVDGERLGTVPLADARIDLGTRRVAVMKDGFADYEVTIAVDGPTDVHVSAMLVPLDAPAGRLVVRAGGANTIAVDGTTVGVGTWTGGLPRGAHSVRVSQPDSTPYETEVYVESRQTRVVDVTLRPARRHADVPVWAWIAGGAILAAGAVTAGYFLFKSAEPMAAPTILGSIDTVRVP
jgi:hypothetical protein